MAFIIPWIFRAGTKAKSAEVNDNFNAVKQFVDILEADTANNIRDIEILENTKANINGDASQRFYVADALVDNDAVNLNTLKTNTQNSRGYIDGFRLSSTTRVVTASKGTCYSEDYNDGYEYLITSDTALNSEPLTLASNATYYVFVCGDSAKVNYPQIVVSSDTLTPSYPEGLNCSRRLGSLTTDNDGNIQEVLNEGEKSLLGFTGFVTSYLGDVKVVANGEAYNYTEYTASQNLWLYHTGDTRDFSGGIIVELKLQGAWRRIAYMHINSDHDQDLPSFLVPIKKGQEYRIGVSKKSKTISLYGMGG